MKNQSLALPSVVSGPGKKFWIGLAILFWLYFMINQIPAVWGGYLLTRGGDIGLSGVSGTIWSGRASLASVKVKQADYSLGQLTWKLSPLSLLLFKPCVNVKTEMDNQQFDGRVCVGKNVVTVNDANVNFPAELIQSQIPLVIDGQFSSRIDQLTLQNNQLASLKGKLSWAGAKIYNGTNWMMLGGFSADLIDNGKAGVSAHIIDVGSPVRTDVVLTLLAPSGGSVKGALVVNELFNREAKVSTWLSMFASEGIPDAQGNLQYTLDMNL
jgi:general secretion pathway protein N